MKECEHPVDSLEFWEGYSDNMDGEIDYAPPRIKCKSCKLSVTPDSYQIYYELEKKLNLKGIKTELSLTEQKRRSPYAIDHANWFEEY